MSADARRLVLVVGVGRSGTSLLAGILGQLGFHIPQPEVEPDETNPRGFSEPEWVVTFHRRLMARARVEVFDSRPRAWDSTLAVSRSPGVHDRLREWLDSQFAAADEVVVKDPRIGWFLPLWDSCAADLGVPTTHITMLRHPAAVLASALRSYGDWQAPASRASSWVNEMLEIERATRGSRRLFVRYSDLLEDWGSELTRISRRVDLPLLEGFDPARAAAAGELVDPTLHRSPSSWHEAVPPRLRELSERVWHELNLLADSDDDANPALEGLRDEYAGFYAEAEAIAQSSITAVDPRHDKLARTAKPVNAKGRIARRLPPPVRRRVLRAVRAVRGSG